MRALFCLPLLLAITSAVSAQTPLPQERLEWDFRYLLGEWGLHPLRVKYIAAEGKLPDRYEVLFGFDRDIPEVFMSEFAAQFPPAPSACSSIIVYALDNENTPFARCPFYLSDGELTGKTGDTFKVTVLVDKPILERVMEKRVVVPGTEKTAPVFDTGRFRVRPVIGLPNAGEYRGALILRVRL